MADFRALSQTCRRLREFALPSVWARIEVKTVKQLGKLRELLRGVPTIVPLIRSFRFLWDMNGECTQAHLAMFKDEEGTLLELAFRNRVRTFNRRVEEADDDFLAGEHMFTLQNRGFRSLGRAGPAWPAGKGGIGPDGTGQDKIVKNAKQFTQCVIEVVGKLTSLETFGWEAPVTTMPRGVFDALARLKALTDLRLVFSS